MSSDSQPTTLGAGCRENPLQPSLQLVNTAFGKTHLLTPYKSISLHYSFPAFFFSAEVFCFCVLREICF